MLETICIIVAALIVAVGVIALLSHLGVFNHLIANNQNHIASTENVATHAITQLAAVAQAVIASATPVAVEGVTAATSAVLAQGGVTQLDSPPADPLSINTVSAPLVNGQP